MNETNLSPRQNFLLNLISSSNGISRSELKNFLAKNYPISKPTLLRDLKELSKIQLIRAAGKGKNIKYFPFSKSKILTPFDIDQYFEIDPDNRVGVKKSFDFNIFKDLKDFFSTAELQLIKKETKSFEAQTSKLSPDILKRELERFTIELSWKSSKIEGNTYSLLETETLIKEHQIAAGKSKEETQMILNHKEAFEQIIKNKNDFRRVNFSKIVQLHNLIIKNLSISTGIRKQAIGITGTVYRPLDNEYQLKEAIERLITVVNKNGSSLEKALIVNSMISYIQPFEDGNKRTGRMLTNAILLSFDCFPLSYRSVDEDKFKKALILFYEQGSIYHLKKIFIEQLIFANRNYFC